MPTKVCGCDIPFVPFAAVVRNLCQEGELLRLALHAAASVHADEVWTPGFSAAYDAFQAHLETHRNERQEVSK